MGRLPSLHHFFSISIHHLSLTPAIKVLISTTEIRKGEMGRKLIRVGFLYESHLNLNALKIIKFKKHHDKFHMILLVFCNNPCSLIFSIFH